MAVPAIEPIFNPHFDLPFRLEGGKVAVVEQDSVDDVTNCVEVIVRFKKQDRLYDDRGEFGIDDPEFDLAPLDSEIIRENVVAQEPRASIFVSEEVDKWDSLISRVRIEVWGTSDSQ